MSVLSEKMTNNYKGDTSFTEKPFLEAEGQKEAVEEENVSDIPAPLSTTTLSSDSFSVVFENLDFIKRPKTLHLFPTMKNLLKKT